MSGKQQLKHVLQSLAEFNDQELARIVPCFEPRSVKKSTLLLQEGNTCKHFYFVHKGCTRTFFVDRNGHEKTRYVMLANHIGTALTSFISQKPSTESIEALDDTDLLVIDHTSFFRLNQEMDAWKTFYQRILEMAYSFQNRKIEDLVTLTAKQRYDNIMRENPALIQHLSNKVLASYLDIREETLSRLKSK